MTIRTLLLSTLLLLCSCAAPRETSATDRLQPCRADEGPADAYCGTLNVRENRDAKAGRTIPLKIVLLPALKQQNAPDPLFVLAGGPGQGAASMAGDLAEQFRPIQTSRDIVLVDQRGTGKSNPLECKPLGGDERSGISSDAAVDQLRTCLASYRNIADVTKYSTPIAMDDLDDVRRFLGYSSIDLYGVSYGTRAAIEYVRRHRDHTRAVILDSVAPADMRMPLYVARDSQRALDLLFRDCRQDASCNQRFPNLKARLDAVLTRLDQHPEQTRQADPRTGLETGTEVRRSTVASAIASALYVPATASLIPLMIDRAEKGDYASVIAMRETFQPLSGTIAQGMHFSVLCSEDAPRIDAALIPREAANTFLGPELAELRMKPCTFWPRAAIDASYYSYTPSDVPALILSGELDPATPPQWGQQVAAQWKNSRQIIVPGTGHDAAPAGCVMKLMTQFLDQGTAANVDPSCVRGLKRPPFVAGPSGPEVGK